MNGKIIISSFTKLVLEFIYPKYKYLARDEDDFDGLQAYEEEPEKENNFDGAWDTMGGDYISLRFIQDKLPFVKWSDEKPWRIKEDILDVAVVIDELNSKETRSNPPLTIEEIKPDMWVWENYGKGWFCVHQVYEEIVELYTHRGTYLLLKYQPNRFYRYEVKEVKTPKK